MLKWLIALLLAGASISVKAQENSFFAGENRIFFGGLVAGMNFSTVDGDDYSGYHKIGFNGGGIVYVRMLPRALASVELLYTQKGSRGVRVTESVYSGTFAERYFLDLNYVEVPLVFHYVFNDRWHGGIGASYALLLNSKEELLSDQPYNLDPARYPFRRQDYNIVLSASYELAKSVFINLRFQNSLITIRDLDKIPIGGGNQLNNFFSLKLMYLIK